VSDPDKEKGATDRGPVAPLPSGRIAYGVAVPPWAMHSSDVLVTVMP
jgi:hypothetical protein